MARGCAGMRLRAAPYLLAAAPHHLSGRRAVGPARGRGGGRGPIGTAGGAAVIELRRSLPAGRGPPARVGSLAAEPAAELHLCGPELSRNVGVAECGCAGCDRSSRESGGAMGAACRVLSDGCAVRSRREWRACGDVPRPGRDRERQVEKCVGPTGEQRPRPGHKDAAARGHLALPIDWARHRAATRPLTPPPSPATEPVPPPHTRQRPPPCRPRSPCPWSPAPRGARSPAAQSACARASWAPPAGPSAASPAWTPGTWCAARRAPLPLPRAPARPLTGPPPLPAEQGPRGGAGREAARRGLRGPALRAGGLQPRAGRGRRAHHAD
jgi:hypothetical protein